MGKKTQKYRTDKLTAAIQVESAVYTVSDHEDNSHDSIPAKVIKLRSPVNSSTQTSVPRRDASTSTCTHRKQTVNATSQTTCVHNQSDLVNSCTKLFGSVDNITAFTHLLCQSNQLLKFKKLVESLLSGNLSTTNLSWKCCLDMGFLSMCSSTTNMRYDNDCVEFFALFNLMFGSSSINVLRGTAHFGALVDNTTAKGKYQPSLGFYNFPIPSVNTLKKVSTGYPKQIDVGFIHQSLDIAEKQAREGAQFVLGLDGKMVAQGCKNESDGDVNLWGREKPSISAAVSLLQTRLQCAEDIDFPSKPDNISQHAVALRRLALHVTRTLRQLNSRITHSFYQRQKLVRIAKENPDNVTRYNNKMSFLHQNSSDCESVFKQGLEMQNDILKGLRILSGWPEVSETDEHIYLNEMANCFQLLHPDDVHPSIQLNTPENYEYIKQGSDQWHTLRKTTRVTGSSLYRAIGLDTLQRQKEHHYTFVSGRSPNVHDPTTEKRLKHGRDNEVNIITTLVAKIMIAFLPPCYSFFEVGPKFIEFGNSGFKVEVSADGVVKCPNGNTCKHYEEHKDKKIVIEMKSPFATTENPHVTVYDVPARYVPQILCECEAWDCEEAWLLVGTPKTTTAFRIYHDTPTLHSLLAVAETLYGPVKPCVPTRLPPNTPQLKEKIRKYINTHTALFLECPSLSGEYGPLSTSSEIISPYAVTPNHNFINVEHLDVDFQVVVSSTEGKRFFTAAHSVLRNQATEVLVFMATNKDRIQTKEVPYSLPVAYAMKGSSMSNDDLRFLMNTLRREMEERKIPVLCEVFDGQWHNYITHDVQGRCLTKLGWRHKWQEIMGYSKQKCLDKMIDGARVRPGDMELLSICQPLQTGQEVQFGNIYVRCKITRVPNSKTKIKTLTVQSTGGTQFQVPVIRQIVTVSRCSRPDLFQTNDDTEEEEPATNHRDNNPHPTDHTYSQPPVSMDAMNSGIESGPILKKRRKKQLAITDNDTNILHLLSPSVVEPILDDLDDTDLPEQCNSSDLLLYVLSDNRCLILDDILAQLQYHDAVKWGSLEKEDLFPQILTSSNELMAKCTLKDIRIICKTLEHHTDRNWFESGVLKIAHVNRIVCGFGGTPIAQDPRPPKSNTRYIVSSLRVLTKKIVMDNNYKTEHLQISLGTVMARESRQSWFAQATIDPGCYIPFADVEVESADDNCDNGESIELFSYPEVNEKGEPIFKTFDYTHILTNMRSHILNRGYEFCRREDFEWIVDNTTGVLSRYLVEYNMDSQNAFSAMKLFGEEVILTLESNGRTDSVEFLKLIKGWHMACDERGIRADVRVRALANVYKFLTKDMNFWSVPFQNPGRYIRGMTWQTFEALLQCITTRIQLYAYAHGNTYNARSISTLANESFFADLVRLDKEGKGYPKACNVGQVMGRVVMLNYCKHKRDKVYVLAPTLKPKYPPHLAEEDVERLWNESETDFRGEYRDHFFDYKDTHKSQRCRREDITTGLKALRGVNGVRAYFKVNESKILPEVRAGNKPKGFTAD